MQTIDTKLAKIRGAAPEGWTDDALRHLIHGTGGSPRRAKRLLARADGSAELFAGKYRDAVAAGLPHSACVMAGNKLWAETYGGPVESDGDDDDSEGGTPDADAVPAAQAAAARTIRRAARQAAAQPARDVGTLRDLLSV